MKTYKTVIVFVISAIVILSCGYRVQSSANETWHAESAKLASERNECVRQVRLSYEKSMVQSYQSFAMEAELCGMLQSPAEMAAFDDYENRMNLAAGLLVSGVMMLLAAFLAFLSAKDRKTGEALREVLVRTRISSFQRRARLAKREVAMRRLELVRS